MLRNVLLSDSMLILHVKVNAQYVVNKLVYILRWVRFELFRILSNILGQWYLQSMCNLLTVILEIYKQLCSKYNKKVVLVSTGSGIVHQFLFQINLYEMNCRQSFIKDQRN